MSLEDSGSASLMLEQKLRSFPTDVIDAWRSAIHRRDVPGLTRALAAGGVAKKDISPVDVQQRCKQLLPSGRFSLELQRPERNPHCSHDKEYRRPARCLV